MAVSIPPTLRRRPILLVVVLLVGTSLFSSFQSLREVRFSAIGNNDMVLRNSSAWKQAQRETQYSCLYNYQLELWNRNSNNKTPVLASVIPLNSTTREERGFRAVFSLRGLQTKYFLKKANRKVYRKWMHASWSCVVPGKNNTSCQASLGDDPHAHTLALDCQNDENEWCQQLEVVTSKHQKKKKVYQIPSFSDTCPWNMVSSAHLAACTMVRGSDAFDILPEWVAYHSQVLGVQHFYIYVNDETRRAYPISLELPQVTWLPFFFDDPFQKPFQMQQAAQNDCIYRAKIANISWVMMQDIDEYFQVMMGNNSRTAFHELLKDYGHEEIGGFRISNWYFGDTEKEPLSSNQTRTRTTLAIDKYIKRSPKPVLNIRQKIIVKPHNVNYVSVHTITSGKPMIDLDPYTQIRMNHYKKSHQGVFGMKNDDPNATKTIVRDDSMRQYVPIVEQYLKERNGNYPKQEGFT